MNTCTANLKGHEIQQKETQDMPNSREKVSRLRAAWQQDLRLDAVSFLMTCVDVRVADTYPKMRRGTLTTMTGFMF